MTPYYDYERARNNRLKRVYGISSERYQAMHDRQEGKCAICGKDETSLTWGGPTKLSVDHDKDLGLIRGLLCRKCNQAIGLLDHSMVNILKSYFYMRDYIGALRWVDQHAS